MPSTTLSLLSLLPRFNLDEQEIQARKQFLTWHEDDSARINAQAAALKDFHCTFVDELYDHLQSFPELSSILSAETTLERLKRAQLAYYEGLSHGPYGMQYVAERLHVGIVHERIGLDMKWYLGAYRLYIERLAQQLMGDNEQTQTLASYLKAIFLDISLAIEAYAGAQRHELEKSEARFARAMRGANDGLWDWDLAQDHFYVSARWASMLGLSPNVIHGNSQNWFDRVHPDDLECLRQAIDDHIAGKTDHLNCEYRIRKANDDYLWVQIRGVAEQDCDQQWRLTGSQSDIHDRKLLEQSLEFAAQHDPLTQLGNRSQLDRALSERHMPHYARSFLIFVDLDHFKLINDSLGHAAGDAVLIETARRLQSSLAAGDELVRFGGDEFVVITQRSPEALAQNILRNLRPSIEVGGHSLSISASLGIAPMHSDQPQYEPLQAADLALYRAKSAGKDQYAYYCDEMHTKAREQLMLEIDLEQALEKGEFEVFYQPIVDLTKRPPGLQSVEALLRWNSPTHDIGPQEFVPILEQSDHIVRVGEWVLRTALRQVKHWHDQGHYLNCSANVSQRQLLKPYFAASVQRIIADTGFPPEKLILELTESQLMQENAVLLKNLNDLADFGIRIALDDFGTGYCSFGYLKRFPLHIIKVDKSFIQDIEHNQDAKTIARAIIGLGNTLDMVVIAEGVEQPNHIEFLMAEGCSAAQGYLFSKPQSGEQLERSWKIFSEHSEKTAEVEV